MAESVLVEKEKGERKEREREREREEKKTRERESKRMSVRRRNILHNWKAKFGRYRL